MLNLEVGENSRSSKIKAIFKMFSNFLPFKPFLTVCSKHINVECCKGPSQKNNAMLDLAKLNSQSRDPNFERWVTRWFHAPEFLEISRVKNNPPPCEFIDLKLMRLKFEKLIF